MIATLKCRITFALAAAAVLGMTEAFAADAVFKGVQVFNVADLVKEPDGRYAFRRAGAALDAAFGKQGRAMNAGSTGVELRFVMKGDEVKIRMGGTSDADCSQIVVHHGDVIGDWPELNKQVLGRDCEITVRKCRSLPTLKAEARTLGSRFDPEVVRLVISGGALGLRDVIGDVMPPPAEMLPKRTYLAYGSSITHGSNAYSISECYASLVGAALGADVRNLGFAGAARMEPEMADFIAAQPFDYATLEMGINVLGSMPAEEYERRVRYFVRRVSESHPKATVLAIDVFGRRTGRSEPDEAAETFRRILKRVVAELALPNVTYVNGLEMLPDNTDMSSGSAHPAPAGHARIARNIVDRFRRVEKGAR